MWCIFVLCLVHTTWGYTRPRFCSQNPQHTILDDALACIWMLCLWSQPINKKRRKTSGLVGKSNHFRTNYLRTWFWELMQSQPNFHYVQIAILKEWYHFIKNWSFGLSYQDGWAKVAYIGQSVIQVAYPWAYPILDPCWDGKRRSNFQFRLWQRLYWKTS